MPWQHTRSSKPATVHAGTLVLATDAKALAALPAAWLPGCLLNCLHLRKLTCLPAGRGTAVPALHLRTPALSFRTSCCRPEDPQVHRVYSDLWEVQLLAERARQEAKEHLGLLRRLREAVELRHFAIMG
jgi:hypothetical protein